MSHVLVSKRHRGIVKKLANFLKQAVVKLNDVPRTAIIGRGGLARSRTFIWRQAISNLTLEILIYFFTEYRRIGIAETIYRLLGVSNQQIETPAGKALLQQSPEVLVLLGARVLELINHEVVDGCSHTFIDTVRPAGKDDTYQIIRVTDEDGVALMTVFLEKDINHCQHAQFT